MKDLLEVAKIVGLGIAMAVIYGVANCQVTARTCPEFFDLFPIQLDHRAEPTLTG